MRKRSRSEPAAPSSSRPTGSPSRVTPAGTTRPGIPAFEPGSVLRMKVWNVGILRPFSMTCWSELWFAWAGSGVAGHTMVASRAGQRHPHNFLSLGRVSSISSPIEGRLLPKEEFVEHEPHIRAPDLRRERGKVGPDP